MQHEKIHTIQHVAGRSFRKKSKNDSETSTGHMCIAFLDDVDGDDDDDDIDRTVWKIVELWLLMNNHSFVCLRWSPLTRVRVRFYADYAAAVCEERAF